MMSAFRKVRGRYLTFRNLIALQRRGHLFIGMGGFCIYCCARILRRLKCVPSMQLPMRPVALRGAPIFLRTGRSDLGPLDDLLLHGYYLCEAVREAAVIIDLGANVGYTAAHYACLYPGARVIAVEPDLDNCSMAVSNTHHWRDRVVVERAAVWTHDGEVVLSGVDDVSVHASEIVDEPKELTESLCPALTLDSLFRKHEIEHADFLKMDIEGAEYAILLETECRWAERVDVMMIEYHDGRYGELEQRLSELGFECRKDTNHWSALVARRIKST